MWSSRRPVTSVWPIEVGAEASTARLPKSSGGSQSPETVGEIGRHESLASNGRSDLTCGVGANRSRSQRSKLWDDERGYHRPVVAGAAPSSADSGSSVLSFPNAA